MGRQSKNPQLKGKEKSSEKEINEIEQSIRHTIQNNGCKDAQGTQCKLEQDEKGHINYE